MEKTAIDRRGRRLYRSQLSLSRGVGFPAVSRLMASKYQLFDRSRLRVKPLAERVNDLQLDHWLSLDDPAPEFQHADLGTVAARLVRAQKAGAARVMMIGAHVIRAGVNRYVI